MGVELMFGKLLKIISRLRSKIIMKVLFMPVVRRRLEEISRTYEFHDMLELDEKQEVHLNFAHYLPDTEERIERLRRVINKRPVAIILHGPSLTELEERITELEDYNICYFSLNDFWAVEKHILQKINRNLSVVQCSGLPITQVIDNSDFLERQEDNIFISERDSFRPPAIPEGFDLDKFIKKYDRKLLFFTSIFTSIRIKYGLFLPIPSIEYPLHFPRQNSFSMLLSLALIGEASKVVVFGGDGGRINTGELYFRECASASGYSEPALERSLMKDTKIFNVTMPFILEKVYKLYNLRPVDIVNCSEQSHYTPFRKLSYDETVNLLKSFKKDAGSDC